MELLIYFAAIIIPMIIVAWVRDLDDEMEDNEYEDV